MKDRRSCVTPDPVRRRANGLRVWYGLWLLVAGAWAGCVFAHVTATGLAQVSIDGDSVVYRLMLATDELPTDIARTLSQAMDRDAAAAERVGAWLRERVRVSRGDQVCRPVRVQLQGSTASEARASAQMFLRCPHDGATLRIDDDLQSVFGEHYRSIVSLRLAEGATQERVLQDNERTARFELGGPAGNDAGAASHGLGGFVLLGAEHILTGFDHLLFLAALLLGARSFWPAAGVVTAFTVAHSLTLALAVFGRITVSASVVEPLIAASIVWVGLQLLLGRTGGRWPAGFVFGLVHGLGFAGALTELTLPRDSLVRALIGFNVGVELAQLALVLVSAPLWIWVWRRPVDAKATRVLASLVIIVGSGWLIERLLVK